MEDSWKRIEAVINHYGFRLVNAFAKHIGLRRAENLYQIKRGNHSLNLRLTSTISAHFPNVSRGWPLTGEGSMLFPSAK